MSKVNHSRFRDLGKITEAQGCSHVAYVVPEPKPKPDMSNMLLLDPRVEVDVHKPSFLSHCP